MLEAGTISAEELAAEEKLANTMNASKIDPEDVDTETGAHPEGRKRGGVVAVYTDDDGAQVFYDETACEWYGYNNDY